MIKLWSELTLDRRKEQLADLATLIWVVFWSSLVVRLYATLSGFASAGRVIQDGGANLTQAGEDLGGSLGSLPVVGEPMADLIRQTFAGAGQPLTSFGTEIETFILAVSAVLALLLGLITLVPWLFRYLPWRWGRLRRVRAAHLALRRRANLPATEVEQILAMRAISRLDFSTLLESTPDPLGDWAAGRFDRLAQAELASVGLRPD
jgi:hypothetical protein